MKYPTVPVIMYHNIGIVNKTWIWWHLTCPWELFKQHLIYLKRFNMHTISLQQLYNYRKNNAELPQWPIVLTFDDGYLDNWVFAYPLLKKYGFKGTIFINPEFVDPRNIVRKNLYNVWDNNEIIENLETAGFLSWEEIKIMKSEGVIDIQSHSMSHTWFFCSDKIIDFHYPGNNQYPWLSWNANPERKSYYLNENQESFVPYGTPIYKNGKSLGIKRYFEDKELNEYLVNFVKEQESDFFKRKDWRSELFYKANVYKNEKGLKGRYETDEEQKKRFEYELIESKRILESKLTKKVNFLCWAGGAYNDDALRIAKRCGYISSTLFFDDKNKRNAFGENPAEINRIGCVSAFYRRNQFISYTEPGYFMANIRYFQGVKLYLWIMRLYKIKYLLKFVFNRFFKGGELSESGNSKKYNLSCL